jgi:hypothetical protein
MENELGRACSSVDKGRNTYVALAGISEGKRSLGRHRHRWEVNTKINLKEIEFGLSIIFNYPSYRASSSTREKKKKYCQVYE